MDLFSKHTNNKINNNFFMLLVIILLSNVSVFGQSNESTVATNNTIEVLNVVNKENVSTNTSSNTMNFVLWFMGSKQDPNSSISKEGINSKIQIMTSGMAPNRLLIKAFFKKAVGLKSTIA
ncbi:hypothetical protein [Flavobacterium sp. 83]|uniref:hypothetical protein n=1 Tax=Flavobacterium sp. 83 TaxID=1131812 RepID=UPI0005556479|nr:hypothetical protein [Flavobacterium sp. 83]